MVDTMHTRGHKHLVQPAFHANGQTQVAVMKEGIRLKHKFVDCECGERDADEAHLGHAKERGQEYFAEVETESGRDIESGVDMVNVMKTPKEWKSMVNLMPIIETQIEKDERDEKLGPGRQRYKMAQAEGLSRCPIERAQGSGADDKRRNA